MRIQIHTRALVITERVPEININVISPKDLQRNLGARQVRRAANLLQKMLLHLHVRRKMSTIHVLVRRQLKVPHHGGLRLLEQDEWDKKKGEKKKKKKKERKKEKKQTKRAHLDSLHWMHRHLSRAARHVELQAIARVCSLNEILRGRDEANEDD